ncbi:hypothetical protein [Microbacterium hydrothermale]|uniref:arsenate reductase/protein-tyrosine-phosphatase family protein n=1 Tax=Microbacterium hydrothermale TaxID=857427 RepID=UPI0010A84F8D|nr:hypothetical protein [Microbacterium hydrothermale]
MTARSDRLVIVCTANVIRSPFVAGLLASRMPSSLEQRLILDSAGTMARPSIPADPRVVALGRTYGLDLDPHRSRRLDEGVLRTGDTVLTAERAHKRVVLDLRPDLISSVFALREFARLAEAVQGRASSWAGLVQAVSRARLTVRRTHDEDDDVVDPVGGPDAAWLAFERQATQAVSTILSVVATLAPPVHPEGSAAPILTRREYRRSREFSVLDRRSTRKG